MAAPLTPLSASGLNQLSPFKSVQRSIKSTQAMSETPAVEALENVEQVEQLEQAENDIFDLTPKDPTHVDFPPIEPLSPNQPCTPSRQTSPIRTASTGSKVERQSFLEEQTPLRDNEGLTGVIKSLEIDNEKSEDPAPMEDENNVATVAPESPDEDIDDTRFSTFSAVPNADMTLFARLGETPGWGRRSPTRSTIGGSPKHTPSRTRDLFTPRTARRDLSDMDDERTSSPSPTPRGKPSLDSDNDTTNLLLDFTDQFNALAGSSYTYTHTSPTKSGRPIPVKSQTQPNLARQLARARTPSPKKKQPPGSAFERPNLATLLDFDIPPAPTPRSLPSITARELESLKSSYLSQISSLKASLSGKEAETKSLKDAVGDAERRVGEAQEQLRDECGAREAIQKERDDWEKRAKEMEDVLCSVKNEVWASERERTELTSKFDESERRREEAETKAAEMESQLVGLRAGTASDDTTSHASTTTAGDRVNIAKEVEVAVEKVARELHALYKSKHESKVSALKKSYETRWEKRVQELEQKLESAQIELEEFRLKGDSTLTGVVLPSSVSMNPTNSDREMEMRERERALEEMKRTQEEQKARISGMTEELNSLQQDNDRLIHELEKERVEKGDLVAAVEEMLTISNNNSTVLNAGGLNGGGGTGSGGADAPDATTTTVHHHQHTLEHFRTSGGRAAAGGVGGFRATGIRPPLAPAATESRIGRATIHHTGHHHHAQQQHHPTGPPSHLRSRSGGIPTTGSSSNVKSGIMSNIERMGKGGH
ncbi:MAG: hypothetical protein M1823_000230 [Watsoniomyces obsoletus]|nr:MAG: hypothetical protein M1823_000230 [Watsoniomyces obsoletus]